MKRRRPSFSSALQSLISALLFAAMIGALAMALLAAHAESQARRRMGPEPGPRLPYKTRSVWEPHTNSTDEAMGNPPWGCLRCGRWFHPGFTDDF